MGEEGVSFRRRVHMMRWRFRMGLIARSFYKWREPRYLLRGLLPDIVKHAWYVLRGPGPRHRISAPDILFWGHSYVEHGPHGDVDLWVGVPRDSFGRLTPFEERPLPEVRSTYTRRSGGPGPA